MGKTSPCIYALPNISFKPTKKKFEYKHVICVAYMLIK